jgi:hypothetical protein
MSYGVNPNQQSSAIILSESRSALASESERMETMEISAMEPSVRSVLARSLKKPPLG